MEITSEFISDHIPYYLTKDQKDGLVRALKDFPQKINYYLSSNHYRDELLQGDGWSKLQIRDFENGEKISILGIVLSNTCDVTLENKRDLPVNITFAPLIPLFAYTALLEKAGVDSERIQAKIMSIKEQKVTNIFFLPSGGELQGDHIALLDQLYSMPARIFEAEQEKSKAFTLSLIGFYLFILKMSVHFCRLNDKVARD